MERVRARVRADAEYGVGEFAGMFLRGNPLLAVSSLVRYQFAKDETAAVLVTERLGSAKSPLAVDELTAQLATAFPGLPNARWVALRLLDGDESIIRAVRSGELGELGHQEQIMLEVVR